MAVKGGLVPASEKNACLLVRGVPIVTAVAENPKVLPFPF